MEPQPKSKTNTNQESFEWLGWLLMLGPWIVGAFGYIVISLFDVLDFFEILSRPDGLINIQERAGNFFSNIYIELILLTASIVAFNNARKNSNSARVGFWLAITYLFMTIVYEIATR